MFPKSDTPMIKNVVPDLRGDVFAVRPRVAKADRYYVGMSRDGGSEQGIFEWMHAVAIRCGSFGEEHNRKTLAEREGNVLYLVLQVRGFSPLHENTFAEPGQCAEQGGALQLNGSDEHRGYERRNDQDVYIGKMIRDDKASVTGFAKEFAMFHMDTDTEQIENNSRESRNNPDCGDPFRSWGKREDSEGPRENDVGEEESQGPQSLEQYFHGSRRHS